jgi:hypothetical protein
MKLERCTAAKLKRLFDLTSQSRRRFVLVANKANPLFSKNSTFSDATPGAKPQRQQVLAAMLQSALLYTS